MEPITIEPNQIKQVFDPGVSGIFKPYGLFKAVTADAIPALDTTGEFPTLTAGVTLRPPEDFLRFTARSGRNLYVFNPSQFTTLLIERDDS